MWFLTKLWIPFWLFAGLAKFAETPHHTKQERAAVALLMFGYGAVAMIVTIVYACTKAFRAASRASTPPR